MSEEKIFVHSIFDFAALLVGCFVLFYGVSTLFESFIAELNFKQFSLV